ncbi:hypothetical protein PR202_gb03671 [Eleusine coracana subsp. coracana]|uniref:Uncharacterized protein n=1 Tax=Eleusine coracana subsp. coracana TaxID=191504 RepID=A0AAV5E2C7_ELECO|nr:hypothetical protein PR202_gb03671 [Eleusine coracana subsp. coracana]
MLLRLRPPPQPATAAAAAAASLSSFIPSSSFRRRLPLPSWRPPSRRRLSNTVASFPNGKALLLVREADYIRLRSDSMSLWSEVAMPDARPPLPRLASVHAPFF